MSFKTKMIRRGFEGVYAMGVLVCPKRLDGWLQRLQQCDLPLLHSTKHIPLNLMSRTLFDIILNIVSMNGTCVVVEGVEDLVHCQSRATGSR